MPISLSDTIDVRYRLQPQDLGGRPRPVLVRNVTLQGVEVLTPLVHFEGLARPLALDLDQRMQIADIARSNLLVDWIGLPLILRPERNRGFETIHLDDTRDQWVRPLPLASIGWARKPANRRRIVQMVLIVSLLVAAFAAVSLIETLPTLTSVQSIFSR